MAIIVCGDVHGEYGKLNQLINKRKPEMVLVCGDLGFFPKWHGQSYMDNAGRYKIMDQYCIFNNGVPIHWCDGNHEDHHALIELAKKNPPCFMDNVFYQKRGSYITLPDGRNVLFVGGAYSIDREWRVLNQSYWKEEVLTENDIQNLPDVDIDIVISHTAPSAFKFHLPMGKEIPDTSRDVLQIVLEKYMPKVWKFGHFHINVVGQYKKCRWEGLAHSASLDRWWRKI